MLSTIVSCVEITGNDIESNNLDGTVELMARMSDGTKVSVTDQGVASWQESDEIAVYTTAAEIRTFDMISLEEGIATFSAVLQAGEKPSGLAVYPASSFDSFEDGVATVVYPSTYTYEEDAMRAPMAATVGQDNSLAFKHLGGLLRVTLASTPASATTFHLVAEGRKIVGNFKVVGESELKALTLESTTNNEVKVTFMAAGNGMAFNVPLPAGEYGSIKAYFSNAEGERSDEWELYPSLVMERADMYVTSPSSLNGTVIDPEMTRIGLVKDADTGSGIAGVPVTDGHTYTVTDKNGVYQFMAHADSRAVYLSHPSEYELPVDANGQHHFWATESYRNDFTLTKRQTVSDDFSILAFSDVHFFNEGASSNDEQTGYRNTTLPDINRYISGFDNLIAINCGDVVTNVTEKLPDSKAEFAKIKKGGTTVPMLMVIGNHDFDNGGTSFLECSEDWFNTYGPTDYSVNIGKAHIVCMSNVLYNGQADGGYGKCIKYGKGLTDDQWAWLQADLSMVQDKADKMLIMCFHCPIFSDTDPHFGDIRNLMKTFGESHIFSGHNHHNTTRQFTDTWKGLSGRIPYEHNMTALGGLWRSAKKSFGVKTHHASIGNDGSPNSYHVYHIKGNEMTAQHYKAVGKEASHQFRIYDGGAKYSDPVEGGYASLTGELNGLYYFDWKSLWEQPSSENFDPTGYFIVRVFDAGTRGLNCNVYFTKNGVRNLMTRVKKTHRDLCSSSYLWNNEYMNTNSNYATAYLGGKSQSFWYYPAPSGKPSTETDWKVEVEFIEPDGTRTFESNTIQTDYTGFSHSIY